ncbi:MAG: hypothetical protein AB4058_01840 [Microcystaceae cyanobacterium]
MLNQALTEIQSAIDVLSHIAHSEQTVAVQSKNLETVTEKMDEAIALLGNVEQSLKTNQLTVVTSASETVATHHENTLQKTA